MRSLLLWFVILMVGVVAQSERFQTRWNYRHLENKHQKVGNWRRHGQKRDYNGFRHHHHNHRHHGVKIVKKLIRCAYINDTEVTTFRDMTNAILSTKTLKEAMQMLPQEEQEAIKDILMCAGRRRNWHNLPDPEQVVEFLRRVINVDKVSECVNKFGDTCALYANEPLQWSMCVKFSCMRSKWNDKNSEEEQEEDDEKEPDFIETGFLA